MGKGKSGEMKKVGFKNVQDVDINLLTVDKNYQRDAMSVAKIVAEWDENQVVFPRVSYRDGEFHIVDGQHTIEAAKIKGYTTFPCDIIQFISDKQEADLFAKQNDNKRNLSPVQLIKAKHYAGDSKIIAIVDLCNKYGVDLLEVGNGGRIVKCPKTVRMIGQRSLDCLEFIFKLLEEVHWTNAEESYYASMLLAIENAYQVFKNDKTKLLGVLSQELRTYLPVEFIAEAYHKVNSDDIRVYIKMYMEHIVRQYAQN